MKFEYFVFRLIVSLQKSSFFYVIGMILRLEGKPYAWQISRLDETFDPEADEIEK